MTTHASIDLITALWLGFVGACVGSFLNVVAYRLPLSMSVVWRSSHCPKCKHPIRAWDNVPVLGWLMLRGKCRDCGQSISPRYAIVEAIMGAIFFTLAYLELFTACSNLPWGPLSEERGAADLVWNPHWPTIAIYGWHCLMASLLMTVCLLRIDRNLSQPKFAALLACILLGWFAIPYLMMG